MQSPFKFAPLLIVGACLFAETSGTGGRSFVFVFGTVDESGIAPVTHALAESAKSLLASGDVVELWIPGGRQPQVFNKFTKPGEVDAAFSSVEKAAAGSEPVTYFNDLDRATFALNRQPGKRLLVTVLQKPLKSEDTESRLTATAAFCKENSIKVLIVGPDLPTDNPAHALITETGGAVLTDAAAFAPTVASLFPIDKPDPSLAATDAAAGSAERGKLTAGIMRTLPNKSQGTGAQMAPMFGLVMVEQPLESLEFQKNGGTYQAHAKVSAVIKNGSGKTVWQVNKEITVKVPAGKLEARKAGTLCLMRGIPIPAGAYTIDATVEDLNTSKSQNTSQPVKAVDALPGFDLSDAVLVKDLNETVDKFETDQSLIFGTEALFPLVHPVFKANQPFDLRVYFNVYPDYRGTTPEMDLDIRHNGDSVGHSKLNFGDKIRNTMSEGTSGLDARGEQKKEFPYLATLPDMRLEAGKYDVRVTVRQGRVTMTRMTSFSVEN